MEYITTKEASLKWGISTSRITLLANEGRISGAKRLGKSWLIPANATRPEKFKPSHFKNAKQDADNFSFPLYHFRPDWSYIDKTRLSNQQQLLLSAETAIMECRFEDVFAILEPIQKKFDNVFTEIGYLWCIGISSIALNKPKDFSKIYLRLQMILSRDLPHSTDLSIILDFLKTYIDTISFSANNGTFNTDIHEQCLPLTGMLFGYTQLSKEIVTPGTADPTMLELTLRFLQNTSAIFTTEMIHIYLMGIYGLRSDMPNAEKHAEIAVKLAYENKIYFPLVTYYRYSAMLLSPILSQYPRDFQELCLKLHSQFDLNFANFLNSISEYSAISKLSDTDSPYIGAVMMNLPNSVIAEKIGVSSQTVTRRMERIYEKLGVSNKKELREYLHKYM